MATKPTVTSYRLIATISLVTIVASAIIVTDMVRNHKLAEQCHIAAVDWLSENYNNEASRPGKSEYFATQYVKFRTACPNGHKLVDDTKIPAVVKAGYKPV